MPYKIRDECKNSNIDYRERYSIKTRTSERNTSHTLQKHTDRIIVSSRDPLWKIENTFPLSAKTSTLQKIKYIYNLQKRRHYTKTRTSQTLQKLTDRISVILQSSMENTHGIMFHILQRKGAPRNKTFHWQKEIYSNIATTPTNCSTKDFDHNQTLF